MNSPAPIVESELHGHDAPVSRIAFSPDPSVLATADVERRVTVWKDGKPAQKLDMRSGFDRLKGIERMRALKFSPDGKSLHAIATDAVERWDVGTGEWQWGYIPPRHFGFIVVLPLGMAMAADGRTAVSFDNGSIMIWDRDMRPVAMWRDNDAPRWLEFDGPGRLIGSDGFSVCVWDADRREKTRRVSSDERIYGFGYSSFGRVAATRSLYETRLWKPDTGETLGSVESTGALPLVRFSPSAPVVALASEQLIVLHDYSFGETRALADHVGRVVTFEFSPEGSRLAAGFGDGTVRVWQLPA